MQSRIAGLVSVLDIEPIPTIGDVAPVQYQVILEDETGLHAVEVDQPEMKALNLMEAFISGTPVMISSMIVGIPMES